MDLERVIAALAPREVVGRAPVEVADLAYDTRAIAPGALFFCVRGANVDGHDLAPQAVEAGAASLVVERPVTAAHVPQVVVADSRAAMAVAADVFFGHPTRELDVVGVTGTNGKTTTAHLVYAILAAAGRRPGLLGTIEARIAGERRPVVRTTPEAIDLQRTFRELLDTGDRSCAMEASSHASELHRLDHVRFAALVFTNLTPDHLDFHGTMERYFEAKRRLFVQGDGDPPPAAINVDDAWGRRLAAERPDALTFGLAEDAAVRPDALQAIDLKLRGRFNVANALGALAAARLLGIDDAAVAQGLEAVRGVPGRFESVDEGQPFEVVVDYSHTPDSLENALRAARELASGRVLCVFGCGGDRDRDKRPLMGRIASELADVPILTTDNPRNEDPLAIIDEVLRGAVGEVEVEPDRRAAIARAVEAAREGDVVLVAGRGAEPVQEVQGRKLPFDDRDVAREALRRIQAAA
jgi:UDP-N-acetylmuramoyl-L-alanyl-D-glutamate--2,6-diaminopimelate ligase